MEASDAEPIYRSRSPASPYIPAFFGALSKTRLMLAQYRNKKVTILSLTEHFLGQWDLMLIRVLAGNRDRKHPDRVGALAALREINKRC